MLFKGLCIALIGDKKELMPPVRFNNVEQCMNYVMLQKTIFSEVIIEDEDGYCVIHAKDGSIVFPTGFEGK